MASPRRATVLTLSLSLAILGTPAMAGQGKSAPSTGWIFDIQIGTTSTGVPGSRLSQQLPAQGPTFATSSGADSSRQVPSWYFGDGAAIANAAADRLGFAHIVPLDPVLTGAATSTKVGPAFGIRIGHSITHRALLVFSYDQASAALALTGAAQDTFNASSASFQPFFNSFLVSRHGTPLNNISAGSALTVSQANGKLRMLGVIADIRILTLAGWTPFVTLGGGIELPLPATQVTVSLIGNYHAVVAPGTASAGAVINETDQLQVQYELQPTPYGVLGIGVERELVSHIGVRAEFRSLIGLNRVRTRLDARPISGPAPAPFTSVHAGGTPDLQVSTNPTVPTTLSLQGVTHFFSFEGKGTLPTFSAGVFFRF